MANFGSLLKKSTPATPTVSQAALIIEDTPATLAAYDGETIGYAIENWVRITDRYEWYDDFDDDSISTVDARKNISLDAKQINISQEELSQFVPFEMPRRYDNFDLALNARLQFHYVNADGYEDYVNAVNVQYTSDKLRFALLIPYGMSAVAGKLQFEIVATGTNSKGENYKWVSRICDDMNVLKSLSGNGVINPTEADWYTQFVRDMDSKIAQAGASIAQAQKEADEASASAQDAKDAVAEINALAEGMETNVTNAVLENISDSYYKKEETYSQEELDTKIAEVDGKFDLIDGLAAFSSQYDSETNTITFFNGEEEMGEHMLTSNAEVMMQQNLNGVMEQTALHTEKISFIEENYATADEVDQKIADLDFTETINQIQADIANNYYNKTETDGKVTALNTAIGTVESTSNTNKTNIDTITAKIAEIEERFNSVNTDPSVSYRATYDATTGLFQLIETKDDTETVVSQFTIVGGSGGGSSSSTTVTIDRITASPLVVVKGNEAVIKYTFTSVDSSGDDTGEGTATWKVGNAIVATSLALQGENEFDLTPYVVTGTNKITLSITDAAGTMSVKNWTIQVVDIRLESTFNDTYTYPMGTVAFSYTPYGNIKKTIHFILDGKELDSVETTVSGLPQSYTLQAQTHGAHLLEAYITADVNGTTIETPHIFKDILWYDETSSIPVIGCTTQNITALQYDNTNIVYTVYDPSTELPKVTLSVDGVETSTQTLDAPTQTWQFKSSEVGTHTLTIKCGETVKIITVTIKKLDIEVTPITAGLVFDFNPSGYSNKDENRVWSDGTTSMTVSDNFDWVNGGYQLDENGDQYFCIKAGTNAQIDYKLFEDDAKKNGKEFKLIFKTTNVQSSEAKFLHCIDNTTGTNHIGIEMFVHEANIYGSGSEHLNLSYSEDDIIEFEFNINNNQEDVSMISGYEDGDSTRHLVYDDSYNFTQNTAKIISLGSEFCDLHIYRFKVYNTSLSAQNILSNFIADARNAEEMIDRHKRNQIYDENNTLTPESLAEACPDLKIYVVSAPYFTNNKSDKVPGTTIRQIHKGGDPVLDNWTAYNSMHSGQGTSSNNYGAAGRNLDFIMNDSGVEGLIPYFVMGDGKRADKITLSRTSVPVAYLNAKVNIASANNMTNAMLANRYNKFNPYKRPFVREEGVDTSFIKDTMEFFNCVIFIQETNEDVSTHREFADCDVHFYAIGNIGDSKKTDKTRLTDMNDPYECCVEIMDVKLPLSDFPRDTMMNAMGYTEDEKTGEITYHWALDENLGILHELIDGEYVLTSDTTVDLSKTYYVDILEHEPFNEDYTYGWRYISNKKDDNIKNYCKQRWIEAYRFITTSTDEEFKEHFEDYFVKDSILYYYLFTTRYCMTDNRSKNTFFHYGKTGEVDSEGNPIRKWSLAWAYDMDTSLGLNNYGLQVYRYGLEDTDRDENGEEVFREMDSTFFCRVRDLFASELKVMYNTLESQNAWHAESFIKDADKWQSQFPEELWRIDIQRKYIRTYNSSFINGKGDQQFLRNMANGKMKYQRRQWERSQEKYMASKYQSSVASSDNMVLRCATPPANAVVSANYKLKLVPYAYMYLNVKYGTTAPIQIKAEPNKVYEIPYTGSSADIIDIYSASCIRSLGDLSSCYAATVDTSKGTRLTELIIGNETEGYDNPSLTTLTLGANYLLETLNVENVSGLTQTLNLSELNNLQELYAHGTNIGGVTFADGGNIKIAELPAIGTVVMRNLMYLNNLDIVSFDKLTTLTIENCSTIDVKEILDNAPNINRVRILGINWQLENTDLLKRIYSMTGIDGNGYNTTQSVLSGNVFAPTVRQQELYEFLQAWSDINITYNTLIEQYPVTFVNPDGTILDVQYIDKGQNAVDPITRQNNPIPTPTQASTVSTNFTFAGWDMSLNGIFAARTITATYTESIRQYSITYKAKGVTLQTSRGNYGDNIPYEGDIPVYTLEESAYVYYLFDRWDKSGIIDGEKVVNAIFDVCSYNDGYFNGKDISELRPVEIYALTKLGLENTIVEAKDSITMSFGNDYNYDDVESVELIKEKTVFNGSNYIDTGINLINEDKSFVLAIDYKMTSSVSKATLAQCFQDNGKIGFKLWYNSGLKTTWGSSEYSIGSVNEREMLVIRHIKGEKGLHMYHSNLNGTEIVYIELTGTKDPIGSASLVFGCMRADDGMYENFATGEINWAKVWYADLGDNACRDLAIWTHERLHLEMSGFRNYYLSDVSTKRCSMTFLASHLIDRNMPMSNGSTNAGGWANTTLNTFMNTRMYEALDIRWRQLLKKVKVASSIGNKSTDISYSDCYLTLPALISVCPSESAEPYASEGNAISYMATKEARLRSYDNGTIGEYWTRSPNAINASYFCTINTEGEAYKYINPYTAKGILVELSI